MNPTSLRLLRRAPPPPPGSRWGAAEPAGTPPPLEDDADFMLRQLVENFAAEHGIVFMPKPGRREGGLQVRARSIPW